MYQPPVMQQPVMQQPYAPSMTPQILAAEERVMRARKAQELLDLRERGAAELEENIARAQLRAMQYPGMY